MDRQHRRRAEAAAKEKVATARLEAALQDAQAGLATAQATFTLNVARLGRARAAATDVDALVERVKTLVRGGEVELWLVGEALAERLDARLAELAARVALADAVADLAFFAPATESAQ